MKKSLQYEVIAQHQHRNDLIVGRKYAYAPLYDALEQEHALNEWLSIEISLTPGDTVKRAIMALRHAFSIRGDRVGKSAGWRYTIAQDKNNPHVVHIARVPRN